MTNIKQIAKEADVSVATVSRVLDPDKARIVHPSTREKIEKIIRKHQYTPNKAARTLKGGHTLHHSIGIVAPFSSDVVRSPYYQGLMTGLLESMYSLNYDCKLLLVRDRENRMSLKRYISENFVDGVAILSWQSFPEFIREIQEDPDILSMLIGNFDPAVKASFVYAENHLGIEQLFNHFVTQKYKTVGMLRGPEAGSMDARERYQAFLYYAKQKKYAIVPQFFDKCRYYDAGAAYETMMKWIKKGKLPRVIMGANDDIARGIVVALKESGIRVPQEVAVVGYDGWSRDVDGTMQLTTVSQPLETMGRMAIENLDRMIFKKAKPPIQMRLNSELMIGNTA